MGGTSLDEGGEVVRLHQGEEQAKVDCGFTRRFFTDEGGSLTAIKEISGMHTGLGLTSRFNAQKADKGWAAT